MDRFLKGIFHRIGSQHEDFQIPRSVNNEEFLEIYRELNDPVTLTSEILPSGNDFTRLNVNMTLPTGEVYTTFVATEDRPEDDNFFTKLQKIEDLKKLNKS